MIQQNQLDAYIQALKDETTNIYSKKAYDALDFHCRDCITLASIIGNTTKKILDIGSGCGFPAVIIALMNPNNSVIAVESKSRKTQFLHRVKTLLDLSNLSICTQDIHTWRGSADIITAKAFKPIPQVLKCAQHIKKAQYGYIPISQTQVAGLSHAVLNSMTASVVQKDGFYYLRFSLD